MQKYKCFVVGQQDKYKLIVKKNGIRIEMVQYLIAIYLKLSLFFFL